MMREVKTKPIAHIYAFAAIWLLWGLFLPMYKLWHFIALFALSIGVGAVFARLFPGKIIYKPVPEPEPEPFASGDPEIDAIINEGRLAMEEMRRLRASIDDDNIKAKVDQIIEVSDKIVKNVLEDPGHFSQVKRFLSYYLPTTIKLLNAYDRFYDQGISGKNISGSMERIDEMLDTIIDAYKKQLDSLFANQALDIETDIEVMEGMLKREKLLDDEF